jgi:4-hydroxybenzoate polyprenyltransferase
MGKLRAFLKLIRVNNLIFIALTQYLFRYCILIPVFAYYHVPLALNDIQFFMLSFSTLLIAAGGYIINDYFDIKIDQINKPGSLIVDRLFSRRQAMALHQLFTVAGVVISIVISWQIGRVHLILIHIVASTLLWFYSTNFKRMFLLGNLVVAFLTTLVITIVPIYEIWFFNRPVAFNTPVHLIAMFVLIYGTFAFLVSMIREIVKDIEDVEGDAENQCRTIPVVKGVRYAKNIVVFFVVLTLALAGILLAVTLEDHNWIIFAYGLTLIVAPLVLVWFYVVRADRKSHYTLISRLVKWIMLFGILSMLILYLFRQPVNYL